MMTNSMSLILLSTYNGEKYLSAQLESILAQTKKNWTLLIRDDHSSDQTIAIIKKYCEKDSRIIFFEDQYGNVNIKQSFSKLMQQALMRQENFIFFCDQDDVWLPEKLTTQITELQNLQNEYGEKTPLLVHTDLCVVDQELKTIHPSYLQFEKIKRNTNFPLKTLLINNFVTGCALGMNRALLELAYPIPENVIMHDWWCALCAAAMGKIEFINQSLLLYRQHAQNNIGSQGFYKKLNTLHMQTFSKKKKNFKQCFAQAQSLRSRIPTTQKNFSLIHTFAELPNHSFISRYRTTFKLKLQPSNFFRYLVFWMMLGIV